MLVEDAIYRRHTTIEFSEKLVLPHMINLIVKQALQTSTFNNRYNFKVIILEHDSKQKFGIVNILNKYGKSNSDIKSEQESKYISAASALILLYKEKSNDKDQEKNDLITIGGLGQNISLLATNYFLGTLWIDSIRNIEDQVNKIVKIDNNMELCYGICLGYRDRKTSYKVDSVPMGNFVETYWR